MIGMGFERFNLEGGKISSTFDKLCELFQVLSIAKVRCSKINDKIICKKPLSKLTALSKPHQSGKLNMSIRPPMKRIDKF